MLHLVAAFLMRSDLTWVGGCRIRHCCGPTPGQQKQDGSLVADSPKMARWGLCSSFGSSSIVSNLKLSSESFKLNWFGFGFFVWFYFDRRAK